MCGGLNRTQMLSSWLNITRWSAFDPEGAGTAHSISPLQISRQAVHIGNSDSIRFHAHFAAGLRRSNCVMSSMLSIPPQTGQNPVISSKENGLRLRLYE